MLIGQLKDLNFIHLIFWEHLIYWNVLEFYKLNKNSKFIHISTDEVFGDILKGDLRSDPYLPSSPYLHPKPHLILVYSYIRHIKFQPLLQIAQIIMGQDNIQKNYSKKLIYMQLQISLLQFMEKVNSREWIYVNDHCDALIKFF